MMISAAVAQDDGSSIAVRHFLIAGLIAGILVLIYSFTLTNVFQYLPRACTAAIVFVAAVSLIEWHEIAFMFRLRRFTDIFLFFVS